MIITPALLRESGACQPSIDVFEKEWPDGAEATLKNCLRAAQLRLNFPWVVYYLLPRSHWEKYQSQVSCLRRAYRRQRESIISQGGTEISPEQLQAKYARGLAFLFFRIANQEQSPC